jgi:non-ribosomal peptide synthetase component F
MYEDWLVDVLLDLRQFVRQQQMASAQELIDTAFEAARAEFALKQPGLLTVRTSAKLWPSNSHVGSCAELVSPLISQVSQSSSVIKGPWLHPSQNS